MKIYYALFALAATAVYSCSESPAEAPKEVPVVTNEHVSYDSITKTLATIGIEGMTCQAGCARNIQNKLGRLNGVLACEVTFEDKIAKVEYDETLVSEKEMISAIQNIHSGQYEVTAVTIDKYVVK